MHDAICSVEDMDQFKHYSHVAIWQTLSLKKRMLKSFKQSNMAVPFTLPSRFTVHTSLPKGY